jgi:iron complex outermembrane receptor protein
MSTFRLPFTVAALALLNPPVGRAQSAPVTSPPGTAAHSHTPAPSSHVSGTVTLDQFITTAAPFARNQVDLAQSTTVLGGQSLRLKQQSTLGDTLAAETGMSATSFGPGASRPIIRGLGGDRIRLLENSVGMIDASVTSPDHAVSVEPFLIDRIEIVRGPASLLYGSNAVGGVINVITHRIETDLPTERLRGGAELRFGSAADEFARGAVVDVALRSEPGRALVLHLDGFRRSADNLRIPGFAESDRVRADEIEHAREQGDPAPPFAFGRLPNSARLSDSAAAGLSYVSETFHLGASYSGLDTTYGVPGHAHADEPGGTRIDLRQRRTDTQGEWHHDAGLITGARFKFGYAEYRHAEIEPDGAIGTIFRNRGHDGRFEITHGDGQPWSGAAGVQSSRSDFSAIGEEAFLPPSRTANSALFVFEEISHEPITWQFGGRVERTTITSAQGGRRRDDEFGGSLGAVWKFHRDHVLAFSATHTGRAPSAQELYAHGAHAGTQSFEIGDDRLDPERSLGLEASLRRRNGGITGAVTVFAHEFRGYIFERPTGLLAVNEVGGWSFVSPANVDADREALPVYQYVQRNARFWGAEAEAVWHLHHDRDYQLDLRFAADFTRAREGANNLPRIPAARLTTGLFWAHEAWSAGMEVQRVFDQNRVAASETATDGYTLASVHVSRTFSIGRARWDLFLRGSNLANADVRPHTSFVKDLAPLARRAVTGGLRLSF